MFHASERLPHLLSPTAYWSKERFAREWTEIFPHCWHFVAMKSDVSRPGDFITTEVCGAPIQLRNANGTIHAVSNVCAHRHCLLTSVRRGSTPRLKCQYHGWEYEPSGETARIPMAQHFAPLDRRTATLPVYRVETVGPLIFVNLDPAAADLRTSLGGGLEAIEIGFGKGWEQVLFREFSHSVNWKIPVENSLEAYHVPAIHPDTFQEDPGEERSDHIFGARGTSFHTKLPFAIHSTRDAWFQKTEGRVFQWLTGDHPTARYELHHVFPNILVSLTDMVSFLHVVRPTGPESCSSIVYQFVRVGDSYLSKRCGRLWGRFAASLTLKILREDFELYPDLQRGLRSSQQAGMLGRCEERIYQFQKWLEEQLEECNPGRE